MDLTMFVNDKTGSLVDIAGSDQRGGSWRHKAFVPAPLPDRMPSLSPETFITVSDARAALAALDSTARQLPNPTLLRSPALRREAQSTSALEGTYAPLPDVLTADDEAPASEQMNEIFNYVRMANIGFSSVLEGRPVSATMLASLQGVLMKGTPLEGESGQLRQTQVVIGRGTHLPERQLPIYAARFVPSPPGDQLVWGMDTLVQWLRADHRSTIDPVVAAAMSHYQFETLHPFRDGNGRIGRFLIVVHLLMLDVLSEPTLTVSPWFEARRNDYYDALLSVSATGDWDDYINFFARGLKEAAVSTHTQMISLVAVQADLKQVIRSSKLRADSAHALVDLSVANPSFTVGKVKQELGLSYGRANKLVSQLVDLGVLNVLDPDAYKRRFYAPRVLDVLLGGEA